MATILETENLTYKYDDDNIALDKLSIRFEEGITTAVLGANGAGKSTLFLNLNGIYKPDSGRVLFKGEPVLYTKKELRKLRSKVGIVFQNPDDQLFSASVYQDISFGAVNMGLDSEEVRYRVEKIIKETGIEEIKDRPTHALSFGQKKRVAFAGIMVMKPDVIILDEPTAGLDPMGVSEMMHLLRKVCKENNTTIILSTHDIDVIPVYADYIYVISNGKLLTEGTPKQIFSNPDLLRNNNLRLPRLSHMMEILHREDGFDIDYTESTISGARKQIYDYVMKMKGNM